MPMFYKNIDKKPKINNKPFAVVLRNKYTRARVF